MQEHRKGSDSYPDGPVGSLLLSGHHMCFLFYAVREKADRPYIHLQKKTPFYYDNETLLDFLLHSQKYNRPLRQDP